MLSLSGCKCQRDTARRGATALCPMHNAKVLIIMVMRGEIRPMQIQGRVRVSPKRVRRDLRARKRNRRTPLKFNYLPSDHPFLFVTHPLHYCH